MMKTLKLLLLVLPVAITVCCTGGNGPPPIYKLEKIEVEHRNAVDARAVARYRASLVSIVGYVESRPDLLDEGETSLLSREQKEVLWSSWESMLDYYLALESIKKYHADYWRIGSKRLRRDSFVIMHCAFLAQYAVALSFIRFCEKNPDIDVVLNEPVPEVGLGKDTYTDFKSRFLNIAAASEFVALETVYRHYDKPDLLGLKGPLERDRKFIWKMGKGEGEKLTVKNAGAVIKKAGFAAYFPVQAGVSEWMGDTKVHRKGSYLVTEEQIEELRGKLLPGDILLERREWYLSNIGLPGYWPHAALYVGTAREREKYFKGDEETEAWVREMGERSGDLEAMLELQRTRAYRAHSTMREMGHLPRVIEAMSEGVSHTTLEHSADCDSLAVLRPRLSKKEKARAIATAFHYSGRPYDFNFDFVTDSSLVCTELVSKSYEPSADFKGLVFPVVNTAGHKVIPANKLVWQYDKQQGTEEQQSDLVIFFDGYEKGGEAVESTEEAFRESWKRPKWHVYTQDRPEEAE
jgi:hypothetical protein